MKLRVLAVSATLVGLGALMTPANAMYCQIKDQPGLSNVCNQVLGVVCGNPKLGHCG